MRTRGVLLGSLAALVVLLAFGATAFASFGVQGAGSGYTRASSLGTGATPATSVSGRNVTVSWSVPLSGAAPTGYVVKRYDAGSASQTIGAGCSGTVAGLSCVEANVPAGSWTYSVTPARNSWRGNEGTKSTAVTVVGPALTLTQSTANALPAVFTGQITGFASGQTVAYRLDNAASGTVLTGSITPSPVPASGTTAVSVTLPAGTPNGAHTIFAVGSLGDQASAGITLTRPQIGTSVIAKTEGGTAGRIKQGGTYYVYANATGTGDPPAGLSTMTANVANVTTGQSAVPLVHGSFTVGGQTYSYRSAQLTANNPLTAVSQTYAIALTDTAGSATTANFSVAVDNTAPTAVDIQTQNHAATVGKAEQTDTVTFTFSEPMEPGSIVSGWSGLTSTPVVVRITHGLLAIGNDGLQVYDSSGSTLVPLGTVDLGRSDYVSGLLGGQLRFGESGTASTMTMSGNTVTIALGNMTTVGLLVSAGTAGGNGTMSWAPAAPPYDQAANAMSTAAVSESGGADREF